MKSSLKLASLWVGGGLLGFLSLPAHSQDLGRVLSSTPVVQQVSVPRQVCTQEQVEVQAQNSGAGAAIGAIAGGALGSASGGRGSARAAATVIGAIGGAILGDHIEGTPPTHLQTVQRCNVQYLVENRVSAYNVVYEFGGKQYSVQMPQDPGPTIAVQVNPVGASTVAPPSPAPVVAYPPSTYPVLVTAPRYVPQIVVPRVVIPSYYERPFYPSYRSRHHDWDHERSRHGNSHRHGHWN